MMPPTSPPAALEVVKVGGSLFSWKRLPAALRAWIVERPATRILVVAGGGMLVRQLHELTDRFGVGDEAAHWLAIRAMSVQARVLGALLELPVFDDLDDCTRCGRGSAPETAEAAGRAGCPTLRGRVAVFDPLPLLFADAGRSLPEGWHVTSDSIAAFVARRAQAARLVLLKSVGIAGVSVADAVAHGWVDEYFPQAIGDMPVEWVNLRASAT
jgi:aspartokinase-like uncharacterized kinase